MSSQGCGTDEVQRIYSAEQVAVPPVLPGILKSWTKEVIRNNPKDLITWSAQYFSELNEKVQVTDNK